MRYTPLYDSETKVFFDTRVPEYPTEWFKYILGFLREKGSANSSLIDLACGAGNVLDYLRKNTNFSRYAGVDISAKLLKKARIEYGLETYEMSILDDNLCNIVGDSNDFVILGQVLHHLVGKTRNQSKNNARKAILNSLKLVRPGGYLIVYEPTYCPSLSGDLVFWVKRFITTFSAKRVNIFNRFHNLGVPVVSYFTNKELKRTFQNIPGCRITDWIEEKLNATWIMRLGLINACIRVSGMIQKLPV